jgi:hypothetical protein
VNGQWVGRYKLTWSFGERSELIYQQNGIVFWIAGDQYDGIGEKTLWRIAQSLQTINFNRYMLMRGDIGNVTQANLGDVLDPFNQDTMKVFPDDNPDNSYYISVGSSPHAPIPPIGTHGH